MGSPRVCTKELYGEIYRKIIEDIWINWPFLQYKL